MPTLTIFAGINGAGKSTLYRFLYSNEEPNLGIRVCPDEILEDLDGNWKSTKDQIISGKIALKRIHDCLINKTSFNWETTLISNLTLLKIKQAKKLGFTVNLNFIGVGDVEQSIQRIKERVKNGGHGIDESLVRMRYIRQFENIDQALKLVDTAIFYDNSSQIRVVGAYFDKSLTFFNIDNSWARQLKENLELKLDVPLKN